MLAACLLPGMLLSLPLILLPQLPLQALDEYEAGEAVKENQLVRQQAKAKAGQKAAAKKGAAAGKGKRSQWSDEESDADMASEGE
jgi:hypothetical protein